MMPDECKRFIATKVQPLWGGCIRDGKLTFLGDKLEIALSAMTWEDAWGQLDETFKRLSHLDPHEWTQYRKLQSYVEKMEAISQPDAVVYEAELKPGYYCIDTEVFAAFEASDGTGIACYWWRMARRSRAYFARVETRRHIMSMADLKPASVQAVERWKMQRDEFEPAFLGPDEGKE